MAADETAAGDFHEVDHSGDIGLELRAATLAELLAAATRGLRTLMTWSDVQPLASRRIEVRATDPQDLLVDWLSAIILASATHAELYADADLTVSEDGLASGLLYGEALDPARHALRFDVKAATYHDIQVEATASGYRARVIFDL